MSQPNGTPKPASDALEEIIAAARHLKLPADAHVVGEAVVVMRIHYTRGQSALACWQRANETSAGTT